MKRSIISTKDGSSSILVQDLGETYHSVHGAIQEGEYVYIQQGLNRCNKQNIRVLEFGFGTALNFLLTHKEVLHTDKKVDYTGIEAYPITNEESLLLNYDALLPNLPQSLQEIHSLEWNKKHQLSPNMELTKVLSTFEEVQFSALFDVVYYDVFGYNYQPELWTEEMFDKTYKLLNDKGILVTYACKGIIRQNMKNVGFLVQKVPGPPGKREMIVAIK